MAGEETKVVLEDYTRFKKILKEADPALRKAMDKEIRSFLTPVSSLANTKAPSTVLSGWTPAAEGSGKWAAKAWDQSTVQRGIAVRQGGKRSKGSATSSAWKIINKSAPGAIYELAGKKSKGKTVAGRTFVHMLTERGGSPSRLIWAAWDERGGEKAIIRSVAETINKYENELQRLLN